MRILLLHSSSDVYGASKIFLQTVKVFQQQGHTCHVVVSNEGPLVEQLRKCGAHVQMINLGIIRRKYFTPMGIINRISKCTNASKQLSDIIQKQNIELIYSNTTAVLIGVWVANKNKIPHYWHVHEIIEKPRFLFHMIRWMMKNRSTKIICVSKAVQDHWSKNDASLQSKMQLIYNGIEPIEKSTKPNFKSQYSIPSNAIVIGMAGRVHYWKGQAYFLQIAKQLLQLVSPNEIQAPLYFIITGDAFPGYEYLVKDIQHFIQSNKLGDRIFYTGFENQMDSFYSAVDIVILPSQLPDPLPTVVLEAMQYGIPVVATPQGGAMEMITNNETGLLIPMNDVSIAVEKIQALIQSKNYLSMGLMAKQKVQQYFSVMSFEQNMSKLMQS